MKIDNILKYKLLIILFSFLLSIYLIEYGLIHNYIKTLILIILSLIINSSLIKNILLLILIINAVDNIFQIGILIQNSQNFFENEQRYIGNIFELSINIIIVNLIFHIIREEGISSFENHREEKELEDKTDDI